MNSTHAENILFSYIMKLEYYTIQASDFRVLLQDYTIVTQIVGNTSAYHRITVSLSNVSCYVVLSIRQS